jgi:cell division protease FtsH
MSNDNNEKENGVRKKPGFFKLPGKGRFRFSIWFFVAGIVILLAVNSLITPSGQREIEYSAFKGMIADGQIARVAIGETTILGYQAQAPNTDSSPIGGIGAIRPTVFKTAKVDDPGFIPLLDSQGVNYFAVPIKSRPILSFILSWIVPLAFILVIWRFFMSKMGGSGSNVLSFGKSKAQIVAEGDTGVKFGDVAGADESKMELEEVVDFLKDSKRYTDIGGKIPKGVLLVGPPGTGKTLLARAVAGEAKVPFFKMSGADFVEMFVGVGASRVRDLFKQAREKAPCIIFIDELDAVGRTRATSMSSNDEREQTLNQLLVEMDGFDSRTGVIIVAATNRPEILDPALLRPGRFDRQVLVDRPDRQGRKEILQIHAKGVKLDASVNLEKVARGTPGLVGADLANLVNEAALHAVREKRKIVSQEDFEESIEKVIGGLKKKNRLSDPKERERVAIHETGHAVTAALTAGSDPVEKISIIPRGLAALGYTIQLPDEERFLMTQTELVSRIDVLLGGRAAEYVMLGDISTGAADDLSKATDIIRKMITEYGMSEKFRNVYLPSRRGGSFLDSESGILQREYSEKTQGYIDDEITKMIDDRYETVLAKLRGRTDLLRRITDALLEHETLDADAFSSLVADRRQVS